MFNGIRYIWNVQTDRWSDISVCIMYSHNIIHALAYFIPEDFFFGIFEELVIFYFKLFRNSQNNFLFPNTLLNTTTTMIEFRMPIFENRKLNNGICQMLASGTPESQTDSLISGKTEAKKYIQARVSHMQRNGCVCVLRYSNAATVCSMPPPILRRNLTFASA